MSEEDQKAFKMFGRLPQKNLLSKMQKVRFPAISPLCARLAVSTLQEGSRQPLRAGKVAYVGMAELLKEWEGRGGAGIVERNDEGTLVTATKFLRYTGIQHIYKSRSGKSRRCDQALGCYPAY